MKEICKRFSQFSFRQTSDRQMPYEAFFAAKLQPLFAWRKNTYALMGKHR